MNLQVGNIVLLESDSAIPADIVVLSTSHEEHICYIETSNLDGETNLKIRSSLPETASIFEGELDLAMRMIHKLDGGELNSEHPNNRLYTYEGSLKLKGHPKATPIDNGNILLRGSTVKNTKWLIGVIVFTGIDTKLMMNSKVPPHKRSNVERRVNRYLIIVFTMLMIISLLSASISIVNIIQEPDTNEYITGQSSSSFAALNFITFLILYNSLVPISLYVTMDIVRVVQAKFIQWDLRMYYEPIDRPAIAKTGDLNEDLGQIEYIFSDKTGTLTENQMEFKLCSIRGKLYGKTEATSDDRDVSINPHPKFKFFDSSLINDLRGPKRNEISEYLELLAVCHTVIPDKNNNGDLVYQAASPDEEALVIAAHSLGYSFFKSKPGYVAIKIEGDVYEYKVLGINEFSSDRKRMSIVVESLTEVSRPPVLYCKGADNLMLERVTASAAEKEHITKQLYDFSVKGLRTLVVAKRELTREQATDFEKKWTGAKNAMADRTKRLEEVAAEFEVNMELIGATAIEDKIQEGVPETIADLMEGGVKVWVLTGDKQETAINIGYSCKMLKQEMEVMIINAHSLESAKSQLKKALLKNVYKSQEMNSSNIIRLDEFEEFEQEIDVESLNLGLVIDGETLLYVFSDLQAMKHFAMLSCLCHAVICCRVSPLQKSEVVKLVKCNFQFAPMTLAIGDGANDVSMIQEAHVGIGICGKEGLQAVNSSDYAIARFKFLLPLLFLHGRWNYQRITMVILYSFYKNFILVLPMFYFSFYNMYSGTALYDSWLLLSYNVALTALPIVILGSVDKDLEPEDILSNPSLYQDGIYSRLFNAKIFIKWTFKAIYQSLFIFYFIAKPAMTIISKEGESESLIMIGTVAFFSIVQTVSYMILLKMNN